MKTLDGVWCGATFSPDKVYRYTLTRRWDATLPLLVCVGLNPSTASETEDDPTVRKWQGYARLWGRASAKLADGSSRGGGPYGGIVVVNLFALRATDPRAMKAHPAPVGPDNDATLVGFCAGSRVLCSWGAHGRHLNRDRSVERLLKATGASTGTRFMCMGRNKDGTPVHVLYMPIEREPEGYEWT